MVAHGRVPEGSARGRPLVGWITDPDAFTEVITNVLGERPLRPLLEGTTGPAEPEADAAR